MTAPPTARSGYLLIASAAISWGFWPYILACAEKRGPLSASVEAVLVLGLMGLFTIPFLFFDRANRDARTPRDWLAVAWLGVGDALNIVLLFIAYQKTTVAVAVLSHYLAPMLIAVSAPFVLKEATDRRALVGVGMAFFGLFVVLEPWSASLTGKDAVGALAGFGSAVCYASNVLVQKRFARAFSGTELMCFHTATGLPLLLALTSKSEWLSLTPASLGIVAFGALVPGALGGLFFVWGIRRVRASHGSTLTLLEPLSAVLVGALLMGQRVGVATFVGGALILLAARVVVGGGER